MQPKLEIYNGDGIEMLERIEQPFITVTDPPFNIGYHYGMYADKKNDKAYIAQMAAVVRKGCGCVMINYPETLYAISAATGIIPEKVCSWVYNSNTSKQHRDVAFFGVKPDFSKVRQPYKNPNDKRIKERIEKGAGGGAAL